MAKRDDSNKKPEDVGSQSPASWEAGLQRESGRRGAEAAQQGGSGRQPAQASNRRGARHEEEAAGRRGFEPGHAPSEQGEKDHPSPHVIAQHQQGAKPRSGSHVRGDRSEERARGGEPREEHTAHGRQSVSGSRSQNLRDDED